MDKFEKAEKICQKTGVSFEEAREALDACNEDMLDAIVWLEQRGRVAENRTAQYATASNDAYQASEEMSRAQSEYEKSTEGTRFSAALDRVMEGLKRVLKKSIDTTFVAERKGQRIVSMPALVIILLAIIAFWITLPLLIVGLFFDFRYRFEGIETVTLDINEVMDKVSDGAANLKKDVRGDSKTE